MVTEVPIRGQVCIRRGMDAVLGALLAKADRKRPLILPVHSKDRLSWGGGIQAVHVGTCLANAGVRLM